MRKIIISLVFLTILSACSQLSTQDQRTRSFLDETQFTIQDITEEYYTQKRDTLFKEVYLQQEFTGEKYNSYLEEMQVTVRKISSKIDPGLSLELFDTKLSAEEFVSYQYILNSPLESSYSGGCSNGIFPIINEDTTNLTRKTCAAFADTFSHYAKSSNNTLLINSPQRDQNLPGREDFYWNIINTINE